MRFIKQLGCREKLNPDHDRLVLKLRQLYQKVPKELRTTKRCYVQSLPTSLILLISRLDAVAVCMGNSIAFFTDRLAQREFTDDDLFWLLCHELAHLACGHGPNVNPLELMEREANELLASLGVTWHSDMAFT